MASQVADCRVSKCGLRPRCRDFPRAKTPPHPGEAHGGREVLLPGYKNKLLQSLDIKKENNSHLGKNKNGLRLREKQMISRKKITQKDKYACNMQGHV